MNENPEKRDDQDPAPLKHSDAERVPAGGDAEGQAQEDDLTNDPPGKPQQDAEEG